MDKPKLFTLRLTTAERAKLDQARVRFGMRSTADLLRHLIQKAAEGQ